MSAAGRTPAPWIGTLVAVVISAVCGAAIGVLFTVAHRATVSMWGLPVPYGIVLGVIAVGLLLAATRLLWDSRWPALGAAVGVCAAIAVFPVEGPGGGLVIIDDALGWTWIIVPSFVAVLGVVWPQARARRADTMEAEAAEQGRPVSSAQEPS